MAKGGVDRLTGKLLSLMSVDQITNIFRFHFDASDKSGDCFLKFNGIVNRKLVETKGARGFAFKICP